MAEIADVFREYGQAYRKENGLPYRFHKVMNAIEDCRTAKLGGHKDKCDTCGHIKISYNSCRNRHCPKCQGAAREKWLLDRKKDLLPIGYFHAVLTIPDELNPLVLQNQKQLYSLLFKTGSATLMELCKDSKYLEAEPGLISILHTWGQNLMFHPHLHFIITGGGLSLDGEKWISSRDDFFLPVKVISSLLKKKFLGELKKLYLKGKLSMHGSIKHLKARGYFESFLSSLYRINWYSYCKPPFNNIGQVLEYVGRYTHRVAISNNRIVKVEDGKVTFRWRDYHDKNKTKLMTLDAAEFIRRFLVHVLPDRFVKIRYYGLLSNRKRRKNVQKCSELLEVLTGDTSVQHSNEDQEKHPLDHTKCPHCKKGVMITKETILPRKNAPPGSKELIA